MKRLLFAVLLPLYLLAWGAQKDLPHWRDRFFHPPPPVPVLKVAGGYGQKLIGFAYFAKAAIFLGRAIPGRDPDVYASNLALNYDVVTRLFPEFIDGYYHAQSSLAHISPEYALRANKILLRGCHALPDNLVLPFFVGFNYFHYMNQPEKAAEVFAELARKPGAPTWFGHLSSVLAAQGGSLYGGRITLQAVLSTEKDENLRIRYKQGIARFDKAIAVFEATQAFERDHGMFPSSLDQLVPVYLSGLPELGDNFILQWEPPVLRFVRAKMSDRQEVQLP